MKTILVVEDDTNLGRLFSNNLEARGYRALLVDNLTAARKKIKTLHPDLLIIDILLDCENGLELVQELYTQPQFRRLPIIITSASPPHIQKSKVYPNIRYRLVKPFDVQTLISAVLSLTSCA